MFFVAYQKSSILLVKEFFLFLFLTVFSQVPFLEKIKGQVGILMGKIDLKKVFAPSTIGVVCSPPILPILHTDYSILFSFLVPAYLTSFFFFTFLVDNDFYI